MAVSLQRAENEYILKLSQAGLSREAATLAIVLVTRAHARPEQELIDIMAQYAGLEDAATVRGGLKELRGMNWVVDDESYGSTLTHQAPDLRVRIAQKIGEPAAAQQLQQLRASLEGVNIHR